MRTLGRLSSTSVVRTAATLALTTLLACAAGGLPKWKSVPMPLHDEGALQIKRAYDTSFPVRTLAVADGKIFTPPGNKSGIVFRHVDRAGLLSEPQQFSSIGRQVRALAAASDGRVWTVVSDGTQVVGYRPDGTAQQFALPSDGEPVKVIALAWQQSRSRIWGIDRLGHRLLLWDTDHPEEPPITVGKRGRAPGDFNHPKDLAVQPDGSVVVLDALNLRIQRFDSDGRYLGSLPADSAPPLERPLLIAADGDGSVWVLDDGEGVLRRIARNGSTETLLWPAAPPGATDMTFDEAGRLWIATPLASRLYMYD